MSHNLRYVMLIKFVFGGQMGDNYFKLLPTLTKIRHIITGLIVASGVLKKIKSSSISSR